TAVPQPVVQETAVPQPVVQETAVPQPVVQETAVPQPVVQETVPQPVVQETAVPQPVVQETAVPQPVVQETVPQTTVSTSIVEEMAGKTVEKAVVITNRRNNQPQPQTVKLYNPSLLMRPRYEPADVISAERDSSLVDWLESSGRMLPRDPVESEKYTEEEEEISDLIAVDDNFNDDDVLDDNADESG
ncbi:DUF3134 family protein, partial [Okeania sp.]|uniref:DUF3134 domain-containing protein n=1 Tax=Okeania sp. TaxID=3100323 RepID=UPI002B4B09E3